MKHIAQTPLVCAICKHLVDQGVDDCEPRHLSACVKAADLIVAEFARDPVMASPGMGAAAWIQSDDTGMSSRYLLAVLTGASMGDTPHAVPHDPADFGRCVRMLDAVPEARIALNQRRFFNRDKLNDIVGPVWCVLIERWPELEALYREELPSGECPKLYEQMRRIIDGSEASMSTSGGGGGS